MRVATLIARYLLGIMFFVFGLNGFLHFIPETLPPGMAGQYLVLLSGSHILTVVYLLQLLSGILLLAGRFVPVALTLLGPVIANILLFHITMAPGGIAPGLVAFLLWLVVFYSVRSAFAGIFAPKASETV